MPATQVAQPKRSRPAAERGAALFVVVMVITLLTSVGLFAARSTSLVDAATGYARQAAQAVALADYGAQLVASELGQGRAEWVFKLMDQRNQYCPTLGDQAISPNPQPCYAYNYNQLEARVEANTTASVSGIQNIIAYQTDAVDGSLGPKFPNAATTQGVDGILAVELFDAFQIANIVGQNANKAAGRVVTINSLAQMRPFSALGERSQTNSTWCSANPNAASAASLLSVRSQIVVPTL